MVSKIGRLTLTSCGIRLLQVVALGLDSNLGLLNRNVCSILTAFSLLPYPLVTFMSISYNVSLSCSSLRDMLCGIHLFLCEGDSPSLFEKSALQHIVQ